MRNGSRTLGKFTKNSLSVYNIYIHRQRDVKQIIWKKENDEGVYGSK